MPLLFPLLAVLIVIGAIAYFARRRPPEAPTPPVPAPPPAFPEPPAITGPGDLMALVEGARAYHARGDRAAAGRLLGRVFAEAALSDAHRVATEHARSWLDAIRPQVSPPVIAALQEAAERMLAALQREALPAARSQLARAIALAAPAADPAGDLLLAGLDAAILSPKAAEPPAAEHFVAAAEALTGPGGPAAALAALTRAEAILTALQDPRAARAQAMRVAVAGAPVSEAENWFRRADLLEAADRLEDALAAQDRAVALDPSLARAWADRGHVLNRLGRHQESVDSQERSLQLTPDSPHAWLNKAEQEALLGRVDAAARSYRRFLEACPPGDLPDLVTRANRQLDALARLQEGATWQKLAHEAAQLAGLGAPADAEAVYRRIVDLEPSVAGVALHNLGAAWEQAGDEGRALAAYGEALTNAPTQVPSLESAGRLLRQQRRWPEALAAWRALLAIEPDHPTARDEGADLAWRLGRLDVVQALVPVAGLLTRAPHPRRLRAIALLAAGDAEGALALLEALPADYYEAWIDRGLALAALGRAGEAQAAYLRAHPASGRRAYHLARPGTPDETQLLTQAVMGLAAQDRADGLDAQAAAELADARRRLDPATLTKLDQAEAARQAALDALET